jgi:glyoxylase-like metal-dependent hydrolase (beta-lactamase superfamily II)
LTALVDTCVGNDKDRGGRAPFHMMRTQFLSDLRAAGVPPESVDLVICTHLHVDHVGWNTRLENGRWVPHLPARPPPLRAAGVRALVRRGRMGTRGILRDSVQPVLDAGLATLVDMDHRVSTSSGWSPRRATHPAT